MQKYVIEKSPSKHSIKVNGGKPNANDDKAMIMRGYLLKDKDFQKITMYSFNGQFTDRSTTLPQYIPLT